VRAYDGEPDYTAAVEETFAKFRRGEAKDYRVKYPERASLDHIEAQIVERVARLHPAPFAGARARIFYVSHLYEFARGAFDASRDDVLFLRAERRADGTRTFRVVEAEPLATSFGADLYRRIFADAAEVTD